MRIKEALARDISLATTQKTAALKLTKNPKRLLAALAGTAAVSPLVAETARLHGGQSAAKDIGAAQANIDTTSNWDNKYEDRALDLKLEHMDANSRIREEYFDRNRKPILDYFNHVRDLELSGIAPFYPEPSSEALEQMAAAGDVRRYDMTSEYGRYNEALRDAAERYGRARNHTDEAGSLLAALRQRYRL